jgi:hypothetical protein
MYIYGIFMDDIGFYYFQRRKITRCKENIGNSKHDAPPNYSRDPNVGPKMKQWKKKKVGSTFPISQHFRGRRACWSFGMGLG